MNYCPNCGKKELLLNKEASKYICGNCCSSFYLNSKPSVCGIVIKNKKCLLVKSHHSEEWDFPGGFLNFGEQPITGLKREMKEEVDIEVEVGDVFDIMVDKYEDGFSLNIFYFVYFIKGTIRPSSEIESVDFFSVNNLPVIKYPSSLTILNKLKLSNNLW